MYDKQTKFIFINNTSQFFPSRACSVDVDSPHVSFALVFQFGTRCNIGFNRSVIGHDLRSTCALSDQHFCPSTNRIGLIPFFPLLSVPPSAAFHLATISLNAPLPFCNLEPLKQSSYSFISIFGYPVID